MRILTHPIETLTEETKEFLRKKTDKAIKMVMGNIIKNSDSINKNILEAVKSFLLEISSDCHEKKRYGFLDKEELKYLQKRLKKLLKKNKATLADLILQNFKDSEEKVVLVSLQIRNAIFSLLSQTKHTKTQGKYVIRKRLGFKKKSDIKDSEELVKNIEGAIANFATYNSFTKDELTEEINKLSFNFDFSNQVQILFDQILFLFGNKDDRVKLLQKELIDLLRNYQDLDPKEIIFNILLSLKIDDSHPIMQEIRKGCEALKLAHLFPTVPGKSGPDFFEVPKEFPPTDILQKYIGYYFKAGKLVTNKSDFRNVCRFKEGKYRCYLKFGIGITDEEKIGILIEYATFLFSSCLIGHGIPYSRLCRLSLNGEQVLTLAVSELKQVQKEDIQNQKNLNLDEESFTDFFFLTLILAPGDLRYGNCGFKKLENGKRRFEIFDNEHNFQEGKSQDSAPKRFFTSLTGSSFVPPMTDVNNFILGLNDMEQEVNRMSVAKFLHKSHESLVKEWLEKLKGELVNLNIKEYPFAYPTLEKMLERMGILQLILEEADRNKERITHSQVLEDFQQSLSASYKGDTTSPFRGKSTTSRYPSDRQSKKDFDEIQEKINSIVFDTNRNELIPCYPEFKVKKFNELTPYAQAYYLKLANQHSNSSKYSGKELEAIQKTFSENLTKIKFKRLYTFEIRGNQQLSPSQIRQILKQIREQKENLKKLSLRGCSISDSNLPDIIKLCNALNVETLDLSNTHISKIFIHKKYFSHFQDCSTLRTLVVCDCSQLTDVSMTVPNLRRLKASNCPKLQDLKVESVAGVATASLDGCGFGNKFDYWRQAVELDLQLAKNGCKEISEHFLETIVMIQHRAAFVYEDREEKKTYFAQIEQNLWDVLGIDCKTLFVMLREHDCIANASKHIKDTIAQEIEKNLSDDDFVPKVLTEQSLIEEWRKLKKKSADKQSILNFCSKLEVCMQYLNYLETRQILTYGLVHLYREMKNANIAIWVLRNSSTENIDNKGTKLKELVCEFQDDQPEISDLTTHIVYFDEYKNFSMLVPCCFLILDEKFCEKEADLQILFDIIHSSNRYIIKSLKIDLPFVKNLDVKNLRTLINAIKFNNAIEYFFVIEGDNITAKVTKRECVKTLENYLPLESDTNTSSSDSADISTAPSARTKTKTVTEQGNEPRIQRHATITEPAQWESKEKDSNVEEEKNENKVNQTNKEIEELKSELEKTKKERDAEKKEKETLGHVVQKANELSKQVIELKKTTSQSSSNTDTVINTAAAISTAMGGPVLGGTVWVGGKAVQMGFETIMGGDKTKDEEIKKVEEIHKMTAEVLPSNTNTESESTSTTPPAMKP